MDRPKRQKHGKAMYTSPLHGQGTETLRNTATRDVQKSQLKTIHLEKFVLMDEPTIHASVCQTATVTQSIIEKNLRFIRTVL